MPKTFLITGGAGFIGSHLSLAIAAQGNHVRILDNFSTSSRQRLEELAHSDDFEIEIVEGDIRDASVCSRVVRGADFVLHHAAIASVQGSIDSPSNSVEVNLFGTTNLLMAASNYGRCERFVFASSSAVYGDLPGERKDEESQLEPLSPYATTKLAGEYLCRNFARSRELPTVSLRYFNVYGPRQNPNGPYAAVIPKFVDSVVSGTRPIIYGDGEQSRDFISVHDIVQANLKSCLADSSIVMGESINIGSGYAVTINDLIGVLAEIYGRDVVPEYQPAKDGDVRHSLADISKAARLIDFRPTISLSDGLRMLAG